VTLIGGVGGRDSGFNARIRRIFEDAGCEPTYVEPPDLIPSNALRSPSTISLSVDVGYEADVRRVRLAGEHSMRYEIVHREDVVTAATRAFVTFAARHVNAA
jgi:hypothetical protein